MTMVSLRGIRRSVLGWMLCQSKVPTETMTITATSAAIGMSPTRSPRPTTRISRNTPARKVEIRVRAPEAFTLIIVWPIIAQPPMPPKKPVMTFETPWPQASRVLREWVSVTSSTSLAVISDSSRPTSAIATAYGAMMRSVSRFHGTSGQNSDGRLSGSSPSSPTVGTVTDVTATKIVTARIATSGAGTACGELRQEHHDDDPGRDQRDRPARGRGSGAAAARGR